MRLPVIWHYCIPDIWHAQAAIVNYAHFRYHVGMEYKSSEAHRRANKKYDRESVDRVLLRLPKGKKAEIREHLDKTAGGSLNAFIIRAIDDAMRRDK